MYIVRLVLILLFYLRLNAADSQRKGAMEFNEPRNGLKRLQAPEYSWGQKVD